jgi:hypothetical protein
LRLITSLTSPRQFFRRDRPRNLQLFNRQSPLRSLYKECQLYALAAKQPHSPLCSLVSKSATQATTNRVTHSTTKFSLKLFWSSGPGMPPTDGHVGRMVVDISYYDREFPLLVQVGLYATRTSGKGNCLFHSLSDQVCDFSFVSLHLCNPVAFSAAPGAFCTLLRVSAMFCCRVVDFLCCFVDSFYPPRDAPCERSDSTNVSRLGVRPREQSPHAPKESRPTYVVACPLLIRENTSNLFSV